MDESQVIELKEIIGKLNLNKDIIADLLDCVEKEHFQNCLEKSCANSNALSVIQFLNEHRIFFKLDRDNYWHSALVIATDNGELSMDNKAYLINLVYKNENNESNCDDLECEAVRTYSEEENFLSIEKEYRAFCIERGNQKYEINKNKYKQPSQEDLDELIDNIVDLISNYFILYGLNKRLTELSIGLASKGNLTLNVQMEPKICSLNRKIKLVMKELDSTVQKCISRGQKIAEILEVNQTKNEEDKGKKEITQEISPQFSKNSEIDPIVDESRSQTTQSERKISEETKEAISPRDCNKKNPDFKSLIEYPSGFLMSKKCKENQNATDMPTKTAQVISLQEKDTHKEINKILEDIKYLKDSNNKPQKFTHCLNKLTKIFPNLTISPISAGVKVTDKNNGKTLFSTHRSHRNKGVDPSNVKALEKYIVEKTNTFK